MKGIPKYLQIRTLEERKAFFTGLAKSPNRRGSKHYKSHLTEEDVKHILSQWRIQQHKMTATRFAPYMAVKFDISTRTVNSIIRRESWKHVEI